MLTRTVTGAMAKQLTRVNAPTEDPREVIRELEENLRITTRQRDAFAKHNSELVKERERLLERLAALDIAAPRSTAMLVDGRPVLTPAQAARQVGVSVSTVSRYIDSGYWPATQPPGSNRCYIFADVPLAKKRRA